MGRKGNLKASAGVNYMPMGGPGPQAEKTDDGNVPELMKSKEEVPAMSRLWKVAAPERIGFALGMLLSLLSALPDPIGPYLVSKALFSLPQGFGAVSHYMGLIFCLNAFGCIIGSAKGFVFSIMGERVVLRLRVEGLSAFMHQDVHEVVECGTGENISRLAVDVGNLQMVLSFGAIQAMTDVLSMFVIIALMLHLSWQLTMAGIGACLFSAGILNPLGALQGGIVQRYQNAYAETLGMAQEAFANFTTVRSFGAERYTLHSYKQKMGDLKAARCWWVKEPSVYRHAVLKTFAASLFVPLSIYLFGMTIYGSLWFALWLSIQGKFTTDLIFTFFYYSVLLQLRSGSFGGMIAQFSSAKVAATRIFNIIDGKGSIPIRGGKRPESMIGDVVFKDVCFSYPGVATPVLAGFNCRVLPQTSAAFVGHSGAGKTTTLRLLERFYDVTSGAITIDGHDIRELDGSWMRSKLAYVQQEPALFDMTIRENIAYSYFANKANLMASDDEPMEVNVLDDGLTDKITSACKLANALDFIQALDDGFDSAVGEGGAKLSGGQKQRVAIARAILVNPIIMLLDEATSALDAESEAVVQQALDNMMKGRTVLMVAHRLSTVKDATEIHYMKDGAIEGSGPHDQLLKSCEGYANLVKNQLTKEKE